MAAMSTGRHIRVHCSSCGAMRIPAHDVTLRNCVDNDRWDYWVVCPTCGGRAAGTSNRQLAQKAIAAGSRVETWHLPAELFEPHAGLPLSMLDVVGLRAVLCDPDWFEELERTPDSSERGA